MRIKTSNRIRKLQDGPEPAPSQQQPCVEQLTDLQGRSGQGADSAMAHLIEQERARRREPDVKDVGDFAG